eukprot:TRINITY_DN2320_c0_g1_i2.p1 TRINITY_DN2320_c0_g1~~TRINITY_DN2320_c0_g1_i2.p1  ORF type:complete len:319 (+),score=59.55 TRINITY_DN2320_c0_g1_i2:198-1154(+)
MATTTCNVTKLKILPFRLVLASINKEHLSLCTNPLLQLLMFPASESRFFSFTDTGEELSFVLEEDSIALFPGGVLQYTNQIWRAIQIDEGPLGFESTGIVSSMSAPLAKSHITIYHLSTFLTDHTLVQIEKLEEAVEALTAAGFQFSNESLPTSPIPDGKCEKISGGAKNESAASMVVSRLPFLLYLARLPPQWADTHAKTMIKLIFFPDSENRFISLTITPNEASIILDQDSLSVFEGDKSVDRCDYPWRIMQVCEGSHGYNAAGIISTFSQPLAAAKISLFNLSTYFTDYALVADKTFDQTMQTLRSTFNLLEDVE